MEKQNKTLNEEIEELKKGCKREISHNIRNVITICRQEPKGVFIESAQPLTIDGIRKVCNVPTYEFELCPFCQIKLSQAIKDKERIDRIFEKLRKFIKSKKTFTGRPCGNQYNFILNEINKIIGEEIG